MEQQPPQQTSPARTSRVEIPKDFGAWIGDMQNANRLAAEYNYLVKYLTLREVELEKVEPRYAGFILMIVGTALAMGATTTMPEKMSDRIMEIAEGFIAMATPAVTKEQNE